MQVQKLEVSNRGGNTDTDFEFTLTAPEINTLGSAATQTALSAFCVANLGPLAGAVASAYIISHINDLTKKRGPTGAAYVKTTIRNQAVMHIWQVYPR